MPSALSSYLKTSALHDATVVTLDSERVLSPLLTPYFLYCHSAQKTAALMVLLQTLIDLKIEQTLVFVATRCVKNVCKRKKCVMKKVVYY
jgi:superfamily II DNA/RNA helicase